MTRAADSHSASSGDEEQCKPDEKKAELCCVIGSSGCLGRELVEMLLSRGYRVNGFDIRVPDVPNPKVNYFSGDLTKREELLPALKGVDMVYHTASPNYYCKDKSLYHMVNVVGTRNVISCCIESNVSRLIATSSGCVVVHDHPNCGKSETELSYGPMWVDWYRASKVAMEKLVIAANGSSLPGSKDKLWTAAIRPQTIFGPGDSALIPSLEIYQDRTILFGTATHKTDFTYTTNVAYGHVLAGEKLCEGSPVCGEVFNISNDDPIVFGTFVDRILAILGYKKAIRLPWIPVMFYLVLSYILLFIQMAFQAVGVHYNSPVTPLMVHMSSKCMHHDISKAKKLLGYRPLVSMEESLRLMQKYYKAQRNSKKKRLQQESKKAR